MEETPKGGRGPPWAVAPLEKERERERKREKIASLFTVRIYKFLTVHN